MNNKRKKIWIDRFQTLLFLRIVLYFVLYQFAVWMVVAIERGSALALGGLFGPPVATGVVVFAVVVVIALGFLMIYDAITMTHRIVGPIVRFRKLIRAIAAGEKVELMDLRKGDLLHELKDECNEMLRALEQRGAVVLQDSEPARQKDEAVSV
jgi:hypothetical protein